ncbi:hypothetical protein, partial [Paraburkholderia sp. SIMBA_030]|uniref:hypothetical protein n=1 Tax=Paraburkholderia sp. SIMBA_030 TaxID=3085773 RepID=UPI00397AC4CB
MKSAYHQAWTVSFRNVPNGKAFFISSQKASASVVDSSLLASFVNFPVSPQMLSGGLYERVLPANCRRSPSPSCGLS